MKIILTTQEPDIKSPVDPRFGRAKYFLTVDPATMEWQAHPNPAIHQAHGAGIAAAQWVNDQNAQVLISGDFGPNAVRALQATAIELYLFDSAKTAEEVIQQYQENKLRRF